MTVLLDCDGVLADFCGDLLRELNCGLTTEDIYDFDVFSIIREKCGEIKEKEAYAIVNNPEFTASLSLYPWTEELIDSVRRKDFLIVTSPWNAPGWYDARISWLWNKLNIHRDSVLVGKAKEYVRADLFIDDKEKNVLKWFYAQNTLCPSWLLAQPYNKNHKEVPGVARLTAYEIIRRFNVSP